MLLRQGIPVLCEMPASAGLEGAQHIVEAALDAHVPFQTTSRFRHLPEVRKAKALLARDVIGSIVTFRGDLSVPEYISEPSGGGVLIAQGCEAADLLRFLIAPIVKVQAVALHAVQQLGVEDSALALFTTECGASGGVHLSWSLRNPSNTYLTLQGTRGIIELGWDESWLRVNNQEPVQIGAMYSPAVAYRRMAMTFREVCRSGDDQWVFPADILANAAVIESAYRSLQTGRRARVNRAGSAALPELAGTQPVAVCS